MGVACRSQEDPVANLQFGSCSNSPKKLTDRHGGQEPAANGQVARTPAAPDHGEITPVFTPSRATRPWKNHSRAREPMARSDFKPNSSVPFQLARGECSEPRWQDWLNQFGCDFVNQTLACMGFPYCDQRFL